MSQVNGSGARRRSARPRIPGGARATPTRRRSRGTGRTDPEMTAAARAHCDVPRSSSPPIPVMSAPPRAISNSGMWKYALKGHRSPCLRSAPAAIGPRQSRSPRSQPAPSHRGRDTSRPAPARPTRRQSSLRENVARGDRRASPSRRASATATARTADESRPPEKLITHGARCRDGRIASSSAFKGSQGQTRRARNRTPGACRKRVRKRARGRRARTARGRS